MLIKDVITEKEYRELILKKQEYKNKVEKKENKVPDELTESSTKKYLSLLDEGDLLNDKYYQGCIFFNSSIGFILFSFYFGVFYMSKPFWLLKNIFRIFKNYLRKEEDHYFEFGWRKVFNEEKKEYIYFIFFISRQNPIISGYGPVLRKIKK
ncbi:hypothetical protein HOD20_06450 [archaeon]|nr:hypothetical protein [archaeon]